MPSDILAYEYDGAYDEAMLDLYFNNKSRVEYMLFVSGG